MGRLNSEPAPGGVYSIQSGSTEDAQEAVPLRQQHQYSLGLASGEFKHIHSVPVRPCVSERFGRKIDRNMKRTETVRPDTGSEERRFRRMISAETSAADTADYHIGNMMIDSEGRLWVIDFDRSVFWVPVGGIQPDRLVCAKISAFSPH